MKISFLIILFLVGNTILFAQKKPLDHSVYNNWPKIGSELISNNGKFVTYTVGTKTTGSNLVIQATDNTWKKEFAHASNPSIPEDSRLVIFNVSNDTLGIFDTEKRELRKIRDASDFKIPGKGNGQWIVYRSGTGKTTLILLNLFNGEEKKFKSVDDFFFSDYGHALLYKSSYKIDMIATSALIYVDLVNSKADTIMRGNESASNFAFDNTESQLAFVSEEFNRGEKFNALRYFKNGMDSSIILVTENSRGMTGLSVSDRSYYFLPLPAFSKNGDRLFFSVKKVAHKEIPSTDAAHVDVWSYSDELLQSEQLLQLDEIQNRSFTAAIDLRNTGKVVSLQNGDDRIDIQLDIDGKYALVCSAKGDIFFENYWKLSARPNIYLVSTEDGSRKLIKQNVISNQSMFSPLGKYVILYDYAQKNYLTYNTMTGLTKNITRQIPVPLYDDENDVGAEPHPFGIAGWLANDTAVLIYDRYDIWQVNPNGDGRPINTTRSYGQKNKIIFRCINNNNDRTIDVYGMKLNQFVLLSAFNRFNKDNGFYKLQLGKQSIPEKLMMGPFSTYYESSVIGFSSVAGLFFPLKSKNGNTYIFKMMSAANFPNLYATEDFKKLTRLTDLEPQKDYNWLSSELIRWKMFDGKQGEGILYRPENFNPKKKYPIIFYYYEKLSHVLNRFINPELSDGAINIPWFVSNGFVVFVPTINYAVGYPGESAYNSVVSAAKYLAKFPWAGKMGLQGHSFGGYETNYIITRTSMFAAASSAAGLSDFVSATFMLWPESGESQQYMSEIGQLRLGTTLWKKPELYVKGSPIFRADKVSTPLLLMHNKKDDNVSWNQSVEYFTALRRLGKKVWMLQYDDETHVISQENNQLDYSTRVSQFFNHYLKDEPAPKWMTKGVPASLKGIDTGLELNK